MATEPPAPPAPSQRAYRAACPNCGAPVDFRSPASAFAVCSFCNSSIVRDGDALRKIGESAELFDDHSPLQLGASGKILGSGFTLVGRLQYRYEQGTWNEWHALFDNGRSGWLSEDNGRYVLTFEVPLTAAVPSPDQLRVGAQQIVEGQPYSVASVNEATLIAPQGELPTPPVVDRAFVVADLRNARGEVGTLDYGHEAAPTWSVGRSVSISELAMTGLADSGEKTLSARAIECPNCGAAIEVKLATTQSVVCQQCHAVVDLTSDAQKNIGGALQHYAQDNGSEPLIPLGSVGTLTLTRGKALPWQVVGYVERIEPVSDDADDGDDEVSAWREYLLYNRIEGFAFIVDAEDGWSWTAPITGVPQAAGAGVVLDNVNYRQEYAYAGQVSYVLGEFYWQLTRRQRTDNIDYVGTGKNSGKRLNREKTGQGKAQEIVWSAGETLSAEQVMTAFRLSADKKAAMQRDVSPVSGSATSTLVKVVVIIVVILLILMVSQCSSNSNDCSQIRSSFGESSNEYRSCLNSGGGSGSHISGGSYGGFSSGGGHK